jgi:hypothetical protein
MINFLQINIFIFFCLAFTPLLSQITIELEDYLLPRDYVDTVHWAIDQTIELPSEGPDQIWDYGSLIHTYTSNDERFNADGNPHYPDAISYWESFVVFSGLFIETITYDAVDEDGNYYIPGVYYKDTTHSITSISGGVNDVINFPSSFDQFESRVNIVQFPMEYVNMWDAERVETIPYNLTVAAFGLNNVPGNRVRYRSEVREVSGWGEITIPDAEGNPGNPLEVLQMKVVQNFVDSIFLGGMPAPPTLLGAFGITQGVQSSNTFYLFLTKGLFGNVIRINLSTTNEVNSASFRPHANDLVSNTSDIAVVNSFNLYPNPTTVGSSVTIETGEHFSKGYISISDVTGRQVHRTAIENQANQQIQLDLPSHLSSGNYFYHIFNHSAAFIGSGKLNIID